MTTKFVRKLQEPWRISKHEQMPKCCVFVPYFFRGALEDRKSPRTSLKPPLVQYCIELRLTTHITYDVALWLERWSLSLSAPDWTGDHFVVKLSRPLSVSQHGQLSHPSLRGR